MQKDALDLCMKQHSLGLTHLMVRRSKNALADASFRLMQVLSLWGARMVAEAA